jgi:DNA (cytosine-5)-methyltransferase 1
VTVRVVSLCSGYDGLLLGLARLTDCELVLVADTAPGATRILAHRYPGVPNVGDITTVSWPEVMRGKPAPDILAAGFPCQDVSCAGGRAGLRAGTRTGVWSHVARAIDALRPPLVLLENVGGLLSGGADSDVEPCPWCVGNHDPEHALRACGAVLGDLAEIGYDAVWDVVSAAQAGAPHRRERVFIVGWRAPAHPGRE